MGLFSKRVTRVNLDGIRHGEEVSPGADYKVSGFVKKHAGKEAPEIRALRRKKRSDLSRVELAKLKAHTPWDQRDPGNNEWYRVHRSHTTGPAARKWWA